MRAPREIRREIEGAVVRGFTWGRGSLPPRMLAWSSTPAGVVAKNRSRKFQEGWGTRRVTPCGVAVATHSGGVSTEKKYRSRCAAVDCWDTDRDTSRSFE